jgi:hypothetical protein
MAIQFFGLLRFAFGLHASIPSWLLGKMDGNAVAKGRLQAVF